MPKLLVPFCLAFAFGSLPSLQAQGPLTPPTAPAPSGKMLDQIQPRVDVTTLSGDASAVYLITLPGSYYLPFNVGVPAGKAGIAIASADVTLDLNGFVVRGLSSSTRGIELRDAASNCTIQNGSVAGFPPGRGSAPRRRPRPPTSASMRSSSAAAWAA